MARKHRFGPFALHQCRCATFLHLPLAGPNNCFSESSVPEIFVTIGYRQFHSANDVIITHLQPAGTVVHFCFSTVRAGVGAIRK